MGKDNWQDKFKIKVAGDVTAKPAPQKKYKTRIAPSPTGFAHIGTFRTALFNFLAARASGGKFILRIDDTDTNRNNQAAIKPILDAMDWLGLYCDNIYNQSQRLFSYRDCATSLLENDLATLLPNGAIALKWHKDMPREWLDNISGMNKITDTNIEQIDRKLILLKGKEGQYAPTYQLASVLDDYLMGINYIIRGTDHISNTPKQVAIWWAIQHITVSYEYSHKKSGIPEFAHIGLIFKDNKKLSKRDGAASILDYRDKGYCKEAMINFMLKLGWGLCKETKAHDTISLEQACDIFLSQGRMKNSSANMDLAILDSFQKKWEIKNGLSKPKKKSARFSEIYMPPPQMHIAAIPPAAQQAHVPAAPALGAPIEQLARRIRDFPRAAQAIPVIPEFVEPMAKEPEDLYDQLLLEGADNLRVDMAELAEEAHLRDMGELWDAEDIIIQDQMGHEAALAQAQMNVRGEIGQVPLPIAQQAQVNGAIERNVFINPAAVRAMQRVEQQINGPVHERAAINFDDLDF